jgi:hypothetical protein
LGFFVQISGNGRFLFFWVLCPSWCPITSPQTLLTLTLSAICPRISSFCSDGLRYVTSCEFTVTPAKPRPTDS